MFKMWSQIEKTGNKEDRLRNNLRQKGEGGKESEIIPGRDKIDLQRTLLL